MLYTITHKLGGNSNLGNHLLQLQKKPNALSAALAPLWHTVNNENEQMSKEELLKYAQEAFDIDEETHHKLMDEIKDEKVHAKRLQSTSYYFDLALRDNVDLFWSQKHISAIALTIYSLPSSKSHAKKKTGMVHFLTNALDQHEL